MSDLGWIRSQLTTQRHEGYGEHRKGKRKGAGKHKRQTTWRDNRVAKEKGKPGNTGGKGEDHRGSKG